jgi:spermidine synthase
VGLGGGLRGERFVWSLDMGMVLAFWINSLRIYTFYREGFLYRFILMKSYKTKVLILLLMVIVLNVALQVRGGFEGFEGDGEGGEGGEDGEEVEEEEEFEEVDDDIYKGLKILDLDESDYQTIKLVEDVNNKSICLFLNDEIQNHSDEYMKSHYAMVDMSLKLRPQKKGGGGGGGEGGKGSVKEVLILGGGDGYPAKHALTYPSANVTNVEIDGVLVEFIKSNPITKKMTNNAFNSRRLNLVIEDPYSYIYNDTKTYNLIVHNIETTTEQNQDETEMYNHDYYIADALLDEYGVLNYSEYLRGTRLKQIAKYYQAMKQLKGGKLLLIFSEPVHFEFLNEDFLFDVVKFKTAYPEAEVAVFIQEYNDVKCGRHDYGSEIYVYVAKHPFSRENDELNYYVTDLDEITGEEIEDDGEEEEEGE